MIKILTTFLLNFVTQNSNFLFLSLSVAVIHALRDVRATIPAAVKRGDNVEFTCNFDLEEDTLYSVKWYKGRREFYRYTPKENPAMKTFNVNGITVVVSVIHFF